MHVELLHEPWHIAAAFDSSATALRAEIHVVSRNNRSVRAVIDQMDADARDLAFPVPAGPRQNR
jgi:hypothetical protein